MTFKVILYTFKNIRDFEDLKKIDELIFFAKDLFYEKSGTKIIQKLLLYLFSVNDIEPDNVKNAISKLISYKKGEEIMTTTAERWINQGLEQGILNGKLDDAKKMLLKGFAIKDISDITEISVDKILKLKENL